MPAGLEHVLTGAGQPGTAMKALEPVMEDVDVRTVRITPARPAVGSLRMILSGRESMIIAPGSGQVSCHLHTHGHSLAGAPLPAVADGGR